MTKLDKHEIKRLYDGFNGLARGEAGHSSEYIMDDGNTIRFWFHIGAGANHWLAWDEQQKKASNWFNEMEDKDWQIEVSRTYRESNTNYEKWNYPLQAHKGRSLGHFSIEIELTAVEKETPPTDAESNLYWELKRNFGDNPVTDDLLKAFLDVLDERDEKLKQELGE